MILKSSPIIKDQYKYLGNNKKIYLKMYPKGRGRPSTTPSSPQHDLSTQSLSASTYRNSNKYPICQSKKQHHKQLLNLVCLNEECKTRGPICILCKSSDHGGHYVIPMKKFLEHVQLCLDKKANSEEKKEKKEKSGEHQVVIPIFEEAKQQQKMVAQPDPKIEEPPPKQQLSKGELQIQQIVQQKEKMLTNLRLHVDFLAQEIQKIEQKIIDQTNQAVEQVKNCINIENSLKKLITDLKEVEHPETGIYRARVTSLLNMVRYKTKDECEINKEGSAKIFQDVAKMSETFLANLQEWSSQSLKMLGKIFNHNPNIKKIQKQKSQPSLIQYKFSPQLKIKSIQLQNENKTAKLGQKLPGLILAVGPSLKEKKVKLKIGNLSNAIMVGVGFKDIIKQNHYKFNSSAIGHGAYMISHNQYTYSHHNKANNMVMKGLSFGTGQQISIILKGESITFTKKSDPKSVTLVMKKLTEEDWKQLTLCVFLGGIGDKVDIIQ